MLTQTDGNVAMQIDAVKLQQQYKACMKRIPVRAIFALKMPAAAFTGLRIDAVSSEQTVVSVPGGWRTQNPYGTMYWAVQGMAAELSTGIVPTCISRCLLYTSPSPRDATLSRMPSSA